MPDIEKPVAVDRREDLQVLTPLPTAQERFEAFYREHYRRLVWVAWAYARASFAGTQRDAEEAVAEAFRRLLIKWEQVSNPWAYVRTTVINYLKEQGRRAALFRATAPTIYEPETAPASGLDTYEGREWVRQQLAPLPPAQQKVMALVVDEFDTAEIAAMLNQSPEAVRQNLSLARKKLRANLLAEAQAEATEYRTSKAPGGANR